MLKRLWWIPLLTIALFVGLSRSHAETVTLGCALLGWDGTWQNARNEEFKIRQPDACHLEMEDIKNKITYKMDLSGRTKNLLPWAFLGPKNQRVTPKSYHPYTIKSLFYMSGVVASGSGVPDTVEASVNAKAFLPEYGSSEFVYVGGRVQWVSGRENGNQTLSVIIKQGWIAPTETLRSSKKISDRLYASAITGIDYIMSYIYGDSSVAIEDSKLYKKN